MPATRKPNTATPHEPDPGYRVVNHRVAVNTTTTDSRLRYLVEVQCALRGGKVKLYPMHLEDADLFRTVCDLLRTYPEVYFYPAGNKLGTGWVRAQGRTTR